MSSETGREKIHSSLEIQNVAVSSAINHDLDLSLVARDLGDAEFNPKQFPGLILRSQATHATSIIFRSGKITCTGAASIKSAYRAIHTTIEELCNLQIETGNPDITISNIVSSADLGRSLNLEAIAIGFGLENIEYEPELFPGLIYRLPETNPVVLLFSSGKLVITGAKSVGEVEKAFERTVERLSKIGLVERPKY